MPRLTYDSFFDFSSEEGVKKALKVMRDLGKEYDKLITSSEQGAKKIKNAMNEIAKAVDTSSKNKAKDNKQTLESAKLIEAQFKSMQSLDKAYKSNEASLLRLTKEKQDFNTKSKETLRLEKQAETLSDKLAQADSKQATQVARLKTELQLKNKETALAAKEALGLVSIYDKESAKLLMLSKRYKDYVVQGRESSKVAKQLKKEHDALRASIIRADQSVGQFNRNVGNYRSGLMGVASAGRQFLAAFGIVGGITGIAYLVRDTFNLIKETERYNKALKQVTDSSSEYESELAFLTKMSNNYGINLNVLTESYTKFFVATKGTNIAGEETRRIFDAVSKSAAVMGLTTEDTEGALKALGQMISKGKVQAEELRGQLGDRLPGAFRIMADGLGVTTGELDKMLKNGELLAEDVLPKFATQLEKTFGLDKVEKIDTLQASQTRLTNEWIKFVKSVEDGSGEIAAFAKGALNALSSVLGALNKSNEELASSFMTRFNVKTIDQFNSIMEEVGDNMNQQGKEVAQLARQYIIADEGLRLYNEAQRQGFKTIDEFKSVQDEFIDKYGEEADNIDILNAVYDEYNSRLKKVKSDTEQSTKAVEAWADSWKDVAISVTNGSLPAMREQVKAMEEWDKVVEKAVSGLDALSDETQQFEAVINSISNDLSDPLFSKWAEEDAQGFSEAEMAANSYYDTIEMRERNKQAAISEGFFLIGQIASQYYTNESIRLQNSLSEFRDSKQQEIEAAGNNASAKKAIQIQIENEERRIRRKMALAERNAALFNIALNAAEKIAQIKFTAAALAANPLTLPLAPIALAQIPVVLGSAAVQSGLVLSQPLPAFAEGTDYAPGGLSIVGEKGKELVIEPSGTTYLTGSKPELRDIPEGSKVLTNSIVERLMNQSSMDNSSDDLENNISNLESVVKQKSAKAMASAIDVVVNANNKKMMQEFSNEMKKIPRVMPIVNEKGSLVTNIQRGNVIHKNTRLENSYGK